MRLASLALLLALVAGCGSSATAPPNLGGEDGTRIAELVEQMNDDGGRTKQLKTIFAGATVSDARRFQQYRFDLKGKPEVNGSTATATVVCEKHSKGEPVEKPWAFVKEGDKWKIKAAPLP